uniref:Uncharacterized protein n=1 Tax=Zea mays TaxID=4577 RepID=B6SGK7_MAIZE|nr:hypothetical protein [Zea mays]
MVVLAPPSLLLHGCSSPSWWLSLPCSSPSSALHRCQPWQPPCCCVMAGGGGRRRLHEAMTGPRDDDRASDVVPTTRCRWWTT